MSLHTLYRPDCFEDVLGQDHVIKSLKKVVEDNRAHTFLFTGPSGTGKTTLARILGNTFAGKDGSIANIEQFPAAEKSGKDDIKAIINRTLYRALGKSGVKTVIIDECQRLSGAAWDALLDPIEEPAQHVYWVFCTTEPGKIPKAIATRCLRYDLKPVSETLLYKLLCNIADKENLDSSEEVLEAIAENSGGSPRQALVFLEECRYCESVTEARALMRTAGQSKEVIDLCRWLVAGRALNWAEALKHIKPLEGAVEAESIRLIVLSYMTSVLLNTKDDKKAASILGLVECFKQPYNSSEKFAPLLFSIGMALNLDS